MARKYGIQLRGLGKALKPRGPGVLRPKPTDRYGQQMKPKPIRPGKKDGGMLKAVKPSQKGLAKLPKAVRNKMGYMAKGGRAGTEEGQRRSKNRKLGRGVGGKIAPSSYEDYKKNRDYTLEIPKYKNGGKAKKFPDLSGDGKVTKKDVLMGRGIIPRKVKDLKPGTVDTAKKIIKKGKK